MSKVAFLGCGRGLGAEVFKQWQKGYPEDRLFLSSRTVVSQQHSVLTCDFSKEDQVLGLIEALGDFAPERVFYFAGGGPYGPFSQKAWKDHMWAYKLNFLFPAFLLHSCWSN